jgi:hypothetical protein
MNWQRVVEQAPRVKMKAKSSTTLPPTHFNASYKHEPQHSMPKATVAVLA